jgi:hypothetical protein
MAKGLLLDCDQQVAAWAFKTHNRTPMHVDRALGIIDNGKLTGAVLFTSYNGVNAELSYYGKNTVTAGIIRVLARIGLYELQLARCTVIVPKRPSFLLKRLPKFGFRYEGVQRRQYGPTDSPRHTGCRFVLFREDMEKLAAERLNKVA